VGSRDWQTPVGPQMCRVLLHVGPQMCRVLGFKIHIFTTSSASKCPYATFRFPFLKQVKLSGLIAKHKQPFSLTIFPNLTFQTMKTQHFNQILELL
jgi:hypothetical protein